MSNFHIDSIESLSTNIVLVNEEVIVQVDNLSYTEELIDFESLTKNQQIQINQGFFGVVDLIEFEKLPLVNSSIIPKKFIDISDKMYVDEHTFKDLIVVYVLKHGILTTMSNYDKLSDETWDENYWYEEYINTRVNSNDIIKSIELTRLNLLPLMKNSIFENMINFETIILSGLAYTESTNRDVDLLQRAFTDSNFLKQVESCKPSVKNVLIDWIKCIKKRIDFL